MLDSLAALLLQLSLISVCLALCFRALWKRIVFMLLIGCLNLLRKGNEIAGRDETGEDGSGGCVVVSPRNWEWSILQNFFNPKG